MSNEQQPSCCCAASRSAERESAANETGTEHETAVPVPAEAAGCEPKDARERREGMVLLPGGTFLMGTNDEEGFPKDGEGPIREVALAPFHIDACAVTNGSSARSSGRPAT